MAAKASPGPWVMDGYDRIYDAKGRVIARIYCVSSEDAALMARAWELEAEPQLAGTQAAWPTEEARIKATHLRKLGLAIFELQSALGEIGDLLDYPDWEQVEECLTDIRSAIDGAQNMRLRLEEEGCSLSS